MHLCDLYGSYLQSEARFARSFRSLLLSTAYYLVALYVQSPTDTQFNVPPGLTEVSILDYDFVHFINFEAEINYPEEDGACLFFWLAFSLLISSPRPTPKYGPAPLYRTKRNVSLEAHSIPAPCCLGPGLPYPVACLLADPLLLALRRLAPFRCARLRSAPPIGIVQVENFGMHLSVDGTIIYGVFVDAILDRQHDDISLDHLSRLLVDVHQDSSQIMNDLLSQYQRSLLDMIFMGDTDMRNKFNCIVADTITPKVAAEDYLDKEDNENELKQVLGDVRSAHDLSEDDVIIMGRDGVLLAGPNAGQQLELLVSYVGLLCRELFIRNYFVRTFVLNDSLKKIRNLIMKYQKDPNNIQVGAMLACLRACVLAYSFARLLFFLLWLNVQWPLLCCCYCFSYPYQSLIWMTLYFCPGVRMELRCPRRRIAR